MTTIRQKKELRRYIDHATPNDRLRHSAGMGEVDEYMAGKETSVDVSAWYVFLLLAAMWAWAIWG